jgi:cytochrome c peroxidase
MSRTRLLRAIIGVAALLSVSAAPGAYASNNRDGWSASERASILAMRVKEAGERPADPSNAVERLPEAARLGQSLFSETAFSSNGKVACATCHQASQQFQDGKPTGQGVGVGRRRTMPVMGASHSPFFFWDGRKDSLWSQALGPMEDSLEHGSNRVAIVQAVRARHLEAYVQVFGPMPELGALPVAASPGGTADERSAWLGLTDLQRDRVNRVYANVGKAIAAFERTVSYGESRFDEYADALAAGGDPTSMLGPAEKRGLKLFLNQGQCATCHNGPLLTDFAFHNTGVPPVEGRAPDRGRADGIQKLQSDEFNCLGRYSDARPEQCGELQFLVSGDASQLGAFRTPSLRNVAMRAPYMHAGQFSTLDQVIAHYAQSPVAALGQSELARASATRSDRQIIRLSSADIRDIKAFLETLSGPIVGSPDGEAP